MYKDLSQKLVRLRLHTLPGVSQERECGCSRGPERPRVAPSHTGRAKLGCEMGLWTQSQLWGRELGAGICVTPNLKWERSFHFG